MYYKNLEELKSSTIFDLKSNESEYFILVGQDSNNEIVQLMDDLNEREIKFFGGIYPGLIANGELRSAGFIIKELKPVYSQLVYPFLMRKVPKLDPNKKYTGIIIADYLSDKNNDLIETVDSKIDADVNYIGGGSAYHGNRMSNYSLTQDKVVFNNNGFFKDAFHLCLIKEESNTEVKFGWEILNGPFKATKTTNNIINEIDNDNASEVYRDELESITDVYITKEEFFLYASSHPLATVKNGKIIDIRFPVEMIGESDIKFSRPIDENHEFYIIKSNKSILLEDLETLTPSLTNVNERTFVFSCLSRLLFLEEEYKEEINMIDKKGIYKSEGAITTGEFSNNNKERKLVIHEGACVISRL